MGKKNWAFDNASEYDTGRLPPGDDVGGKDLPNRGQSKNMGYGVTSADLAQGYNRAPQEPVYSDPRPWRRGYREGEGFVGRNPGPPGERN